MTKLHPAQLSLCSRPHTVQPSPTPAQAGHPCAPLLSLFVAYYMYVFFLIRVGRVECCFQKMSSLMMTNSCLSKEGAVLTPASREVLLEANHIRKRRRDECRTITLTQWIIFTVLVQLNLGPPEGELFSASSMHRT